MADIRTDDALNQETFAVIAPGHTYESIAHKISSLVLTNKISKGWLMAVLATAGVTGLLFGGMTLVFLFGVGLWGNNNTIGWAFDIINFVWWIGIGHAGTLISAILLLLHQNWRTSINRYAEAMTLFAVVQAGMYPLLHVGRHFYAYWMFPVPNSMGLWPQFRSPLIWDVFAISTYLSVSAVFWFIGLVPDLATLRDRSQNLLVKRIYGMLAMGWRGSALHWKRYTQVYLLLAGLSTPLVLSVHTIVSFDFSTGIIPGWHSTIFPPYFVAGAVFAGFAMTILLAVPMREFLHLKDLITMKHLENMGKVMLATGLIVFYGYVMEFFFGWYSGNKYEGYMTFVTRLKGPYAWSFYSLILCNGLIPQVLWMRKARTSIPCLLIVSAAVTVGMWLERFVIIVTSLHREFVPAMWSMYYPTLVDWSIFIGTIGFFVLLFLLFLRVLPAISIAEVSELVHHQKSHGHDGGSDGQSSGHAHAAGS